MIHTLIVVAAAALAGPSAGGSPAQPQIEAKAVNHQPAAPAKPPGDQIPVPAAADEKEADLDRLVAQLEKLGLQITSDPKKTDATTSEAAYFMFAQRKDHRPYCVPLEAKEKRHWLDGKPVFAAKADPAAIRPLFDALVERMGYNEVCVYTAHVHYGVDRHARFTLYKLGYRKDDPRRGKQPEVLLGDADYVIHLP